MFDICNIKCQGCKTKIDTYIGGSSAGRQQIRVYCPKCHKYFVNWIKTSVKPFIVFPHTLSKEDVEFIKKEYGKDVVEGTYIFLVDHPHDIGLNCGPLLYF